MVNEVCKIFILTVLLYAILLNAQDAINLDPSDLCLERTSCTTCLEKSSCVWCVTKSKCTRNACGNDNIIYPKQVLAMMSGEQFCPRIVNENKNITIKSGQKKGIVVEITQIHLYMAFTPWKCKISLNGNSSLVPAMLLGDNVFCESVMFTNNSKEPYTLGSVSLVWDYSKTLDGTVLFKVTE